MQAMEISLTALDVEWRRLEVIAENLANANVAGSAKTGVFRPLELVSGPANDFAALLDPKNPSGVDIGSLAGVAEKGLVPSAALPHMVHEPSNPLADAQGFVAYPNIDQAHEMTGMVETARVYEANIVALNMAREMYSKALELLSRNS